MAGKFIENLITRIGSERQLRYERKRNVSLKQDYKHLVIITYGRSGSTVLQSVLNSCPGVLIRGENHNVVRHLQDYSETLARVSKEHGVAVATDKDHPWHGAHLVSSKGALNSLRKTFYESVLNPEEDTETIGYKEIRYTHGHFETYEEMLKNLMFLNELLPNVRYLVNVRDAAKTAASGWWRLEEGAEQRLSTSREWLERAVLDINKELGSGRAFLVSYDEWANNTEKMCQILDDLGIEYDKKVVDSVVHTKLRHMENYGLQELRQ